MQSSKRNVLATHNQQTTNKIPGAPETIVNCFQSLMRYASPAKLMVAAEKPSHIRDPAVLLWRTPDNSVAKTNAGMVKAPTGLTEGRVSSLKHMHKSFDAVLMG